MVEKNTFNIKETKKETSNVQHTLAKRVINSSFVSLSAMEFMTVSLAIAYQLESH